MKLLPIPTALLAATGATANVLASYSQSRPSKHEFVRSLIHDSAADAITFRGKGFFSAASSVRSAASSESVVGGAVLSTEGILSATGTFTIPAARRPTSGPTADLPVTYGASFWVGIDGATSACSSASLRAGVDIFWDPEGTSYNAWYQWAPQRSADFNGLAVRPGDVVRVTVTASPTNSTVGALKIENLSTNRTSTQQLSSPPSNPLCRGEAAWVIQDFVLEKGPGLPVPLANFSDVTFASARATAAGKGAAGPAPVSLEGATVLNIYQKAQGGQLTGCGARAGQLGGCYCAEHLPEGTRWAADGLQEGQ